MQKKKKKRNGEINEWIFFYTLPQSCKCSINLSLCNWILYRSNKKIFLGGKGFSWFIHPEKDFLFTNRTYIYNAKNPILILTSEKFDAYKYRYWPWNKWSITTHGGGKCIINLITDAKWIRRHQCGVYNNCF